MMFVIIVKGEIIGQRSMKELTEGFNRVNREVVRVGQMREVRRMEGMTHIIRKEWEWEE